jgi:hypothetical protein
MITINGKDDEPFSSSTSGIRRFSTFTIGRKGHIRDLGLNPIPGEIADPGFSTNADDVNVLVSVDGDGRTRANGSAHINVNQKPHFSVRAEGKKGAIVFDFTVGP